MDLPRATPRRVSIVGSTGTGRTTFGREPAAIRAVPFVELDALCWRPNWSKAAPDAFQARVREAMAGGEPSRACAIAPSCGPARLRFTDPRDADRWIEARRSAARGARTR